VWLIEVHTVKKSGLRDRRIFAVTEKGEAAIQIWKPCFLIDEK
jgi:DNA-binding PadR family transcriptional regulator